MSANTVNPDIMFGQEVYTRAQLVLITLLQEVTSISASLAPLESMRPVQAQHVLCVRPVDIKIRMHKLVVKFVRPVNIKIRMYKLVAKLVRPVNIKMKLP